MSRMASISQGSTISFIRRLSHLDSANKLSVSLLALSNTRLMAETTIETRVAQIALYHLTTNSSSTSRTCSSVCLKRKNVSTTKACAIAHAPLTHSFAAALTELTSLSNISALSHNCQKLIIMARWLPKAYNNNNSRSSTLWTVQPHISRTIFYIIQTRESSLLHSNISFKIRVNNRCTSIPLKISRIHWI